MVQVRLDQARERARAQGVKWTTQREQVLRLLWARGGSAKAYELLADWQRTHPGATAMAVYRALEGWVALGVVHRVASGSLFVACAQPDYAHQDAVFLVCEDCGAAVEYAHAPLAAPIAGVAHDRGFAVHNVEVLGQCGGCRAGQPASQVHTAD